MDLYDTMSAKLLTLDAVRERLATTEPVSVHDFTAGDGIRFAIDSVLGHGIDAVDNDAPVPAYVNIGQVGRATEYQLTKSVLTELAGMCGIRPTHALKCPPDLLEAHLNYWFRHGMVLKKGNRDWRFMIADDIATTITKQGFAPISNLAILDHTENALKWRWGGLDIMADYKMHHSLRRTDLRLVVLDCPAWTMTGTGVDDDRWSAGVQVRNSLAGHSASFEAYLFRWICTNGAIDQTATSTITRKIDDDPTEWVTHAVDDVLGGFDEAMAAVQRLTSISVEGHLSDVLKDLFTHYRLTVAERTRITAALLDAEPLTMYAIMAAITEGANRPGLDPSTIDGLMRVGGDLPHTGAHRCKECLRIARH